MAELRTLPGDLADAVARYLVATGLEEDLERAYQYAKAARGLAARVGIVRETCAIAAYQAGHWTDALAEFRAARRLTGRNSYLPLMADCERALGRLDRALDIVTGSDAQSADRATQLELRIVESGIRRDQGLPDAGVVALQVPELTQKRGRAGHVRLFYAYADALLDAGREEEARDWFGKAAAADTADETDAAERADELDDILFEDLDDNAEDLEDPEDLDDELEDEEGEDLADNGESGELDDDARENLADDDADELDDDLEEEDDEDEDDSEDLEESAGDLDEDLDDDADDLGDEDGDEGVSAASDEGPDLTLGGEDADKEAHATSEVDSARRRAEPGRDERDGRAGG